LYRSVGSLESTFVEQRLYRFFHEERRSAGGLYDEFFQRQEIRRFTQDRREHFLCRLVGESVQPHLLAVELASPAQRIFRPEADEKHESGVSHRLEETVEKGLAFLIQPVQVLDDQQERVAASLAEQHARDRVKRARSSKLRVHARELLLVAFDL